MGLVVKLGSLGFSVSAISEEKLASYNVYYYNQLSETEKKVYIKIDEAIKKEQKTVTFTDYKVENLIESVTRIINAYFYDNPEYFYISNKYIIANRDLKIFNITTIKFEYIIDNEYTIERMKKEMTNAIDKLVQENITGSMTDFEKELVLHDVLIEKTKYYEYEDVNTIPLIKHTAYGALVDNEAVCDGYSKALYLLLKKVGIENIIISGTTGNVAHAWNVVKLEDEWYHLDVTSDSITSDGKKYLMHKYFNVTDKEIKQTHSIDKDFELPKCNGTKYDYYMQLGCYLNYEDNMYTKLKKIISLQKDSQILEVKMDSRYSAKSLIDTLYDLNFNSWYSSLKTSVSYNKMENVFVFIKE